MAEKISYARAQHAISDGTRQDYIDGLNLSELQPYVRSVLYCPQQIQNFYMEIRRSLGSLMGFPHCGSDVLVFPTAFDVTEDYFLSSLFVHEKGHAKDNYERPNLFMARSKRGEMDLWFSLHLYKEHVRAVCEWRANRAQLTEHHLGRYPLTPENYQDALEEKLHYRSLAHQCRKKIHSSPLAMLQTALFMRTAAQRANNVTLQ